MNQSQAAGGSAKSLPSTATKISLLGRLKAAPLKAAQNVRTAKLHGLVIYSEDSHRIYASPELSNIPFECLLMLPWV